MTLVPSARAVILVFFLLPRGCAVSVLPVLLLLALALVSVFAWRSARVFMLLCVGVGLALLFLLLPGLLPALVSFVRALASLVGALVASF